MKNGPEGDDRMKAGAEEGYFCGEDDWEGRRAVNRVETGERTAGRGHTPDGRMTARVLLFNLIHPPLVQCHLSHPPMPSRNDIVVSSPPMSTVGVARAAYSARLEV